jgi:hypothetical protein
MIYIGDKSGDTAQEIRNPRRPVFPLVVAVLLLALIVLGNLPLGHSAAAHPLLGW